MNANDLNAWQDGKEGPDPARVHIFQKNSDVEDPNRFNDWQNPKDKKTGKVKRRIDAILDAQEVHTCEKCSFTTRTEEAFKIHTKVDAKGMIQCERERAAFEASRKGDTAELEAKLTGAIEKSMDTLGNKLVEALTGAVKSVARAPRKRYRKKKKAAKTKKKGPEESVLQTPEDIPEPVEALGQEPPGDVGQEVEPVEDLPEGSTEET